MKSAGAPDLAILWTVTLVRAHEKEYTLQNGTLGSNYVNHGNLVKLPLFALCVRKPRKSVETDDTVGELGGILAWVVRARAPGEVWAYAGQVSGSWT